MSDGDGVQVPPTVPFGTPLPDIDGVAWSTLAGIAAAADQRFMTTPDGVYLFCNSDVHDPDRDDHDPAVNDAFALGKHPGQPVASLVAFLATHWTCPRDVR